jgi:hypothetical protein
VITDLAASRHRLTIDTSSCRMVALGDVASVISRSSYLFVCPGPMSAGPSWWPSLDRLAVLLINYDVPV